MENNYINHLEFKHISTAADEAIDYIRKRKNHSYESLKTRWKKLNRQCMGGVEPNAIYTIAGMSGSGKSSFANTLETDLIDLNPTQDVIVLSFSFEMLSSRQVGRKLSAKLKRTTSELYSANNDLEDDCLKQVIAETDHIKKYPIYYVDETGSVSDIAKTIKYFYNTLAKGKRFIILLDHALLIDSVDNKTLLTTIADLEKLFMKVKKLPNTTIIQISQLNRNIEAPDRINNPASHYPIRSDLSSADSIYQASDYVIVIHRPELLNLQTYGIQHLPVIDKVYMHLIKNRDAGTNVILEFDNDLKYNNLIETIRESPTTEKNRFSM